MLFLYTPMQLYDLHLDEQQPVTVSGMLCEWDSVCVSGLSACGGINMGFKQYFQ